LSWAGVDLFFVLSGFLIGGILLDARKASNYFRVFYTRRFFRILPIYAAVLLVFPLLNLLRHGGILRAGGSPPWYMYWTFTQNFWMAAASSLGANSLVMTWSLAVEEQFYLTLPLLVRKFAENALTALVLLGIALAPILRISLRFLWPNNWGAAYVLMPCRADALLLGVLAAILLRDKKWRARIVRSTSFFALLFSLLLAGIVFLDSKSPGFDSSFMQKIGYTWLAVFFACVLVFALTRPNSLVSRVLRVAWLGWVGTIAYGTYLFHQGVQRLVFRLFSIDPPAITSAYTLAISVAALGLTLAIARLSWHFFELPLMGFGHRSRYAFEDLPRALERGEFSSSEVVRP